MLPLIRQYHVSQGTPMCLHIYWHGRHWQTESKGNRYKMRILELETGIWLNELYIPKVGIDFTKEELKKIPKLHKEVPNAGEIFILYLIDNEDGYLIYERRKELE